MHRLIPVVLLALCLGGCKRKPAPVQTIEEEPSGLATSVHAADPRAAVQLIRGFHEIEQNSWRWTKGSFAAMLRTPRGAVQRGALLVVKLSIPEPVIDKLKSLTLTARVGAISLPPETYHKPGEFSFTRDVPGTALAGDSVTVEFTLDRFLPAGAVDQRELGVIVTSIGLEAK